MKKEDKIFLLNLARKKIASTLGIHWASYSGITLAAPSQAVKQVTGTFVTLTIDNELRGCIGQITPNSTVEDTVKQNADSAAFYDPRFSALSRDEFYIVDVEISVLSRPEQLLYNGVDDLLEKIKQDEHGLIIRSGGHSATFLPQVWEDLPDKEAFLSHLCTKAGLYQDQWKNGKLDVYTYTVEHFNEKEFGLEL